MMVFRCVSSKSKVCELMPFSSAALAMSTRSLRPSTLACAAGSSICTPALTTVRQPMEDMGAMAATIVKDGITAVLEKRKVQAVHRKVAPELVVRESTSRVS